MASYFRSDMPRPFPGNDRGLGTTKWAPAARQRVFQLRGRPETRCHSAWISSSVGATN